MDPRLQLLLGACLCSLPGLASSAGYMSVQFLRYNNHDSRCADGTYCDTILFFNTRESQCDPQFRLTADKTSPGGTNLFDYQQNNWYDNQDVIDFGSKFGEISNPVAIAMNYNDNPGSIQITVTVVDKDTSVNDLIDIFSASLIASGTDQRSLVMYSQPMGHSLSLKYWFTCYANYYGPQCNTYCQAQNDATNGHYSCDANGQKVCLAGWIVPSANCKTPHPCNTGICLNGANCVPQGEGYTCQCLADYTGINCQQFLNPCQYRNPCKNSAQCSLNAANQPQCSCPPQFTGPQCDLDVDECAGANPCSNGMPCLNTYGGFKCNCTNPQFTGSLCELLVCNGTVCHNNGTCSPGADRLPRCVCAEGFAGLSCETDVDDCFGSPCGNGSTCRDLVADFACDCPAGFAGRLCDQDIDDCTGGPCLNGGACTDGIANFSCACPTGFSGARCEQAPTPSPSPSSSPQPPTAPKLNETFDRLVIETPGPLAASGDSVSVAGAAAGTTVGVLLLLGLGVFFGVYFMRHRAADAALQDDNSSGGFSNAVYHNAGDGEGSPSSIVGNESYSRAATVAIDDEAEPVYEAIGEGGGARVNQAYSYEAEA